MSSPEIREIANWEHDLPAASHRSSSVLGSNQKRIEWVAGDPVYLGEAIAGHPDSQDGWIIKKITWVSGEPTLLQTAIGAWTDRATLTYT